MSRSSVVYGPFSVVRLGVVVSPVMLHKYKDRDDRYIFLFGTVVGGAYEYICSVFTEIAFGTVFWDYSKLHPSTWEVESTCCTAASSGAWRVIWIKLLYPRISVSLNGFRSKPGN